MVIPFDKFPARNANGRLRFDCNPGFTVLELLVAVSAMLVVMTFMTTLCFQVQQVWKDTRHRQVAIGELSNQLDRLTRMTKAQVEAELTNLEPSAYCARTLRQPVIVGSLIEDQVGVRVSLTIDWNRRHPGKPAQLSGWLNPTTASADSKSIP